MINNVIISSLAHRDINKIKNLLNKYLGIMDLAYSITENSLDNKKLLEIFDPNSDDTKVVKLYITDDMGNIDDVTENDKMISENKQWASTLIDISEIFNKEPSPTLRRVKSYYSNKLEREQQEKMDKYKKKYVKELTKILKEKRENI